MYPGASTESHFRAPPFCTSPTPLSLPFAGRLCSLRTWALQGGGSGPQTVRVDLSQEESALCSSLSG